jgi:hypothetical protein
MRRESSRRLDPAMPAARLYMDPCPRCEAAYAAALVCGRMHRIVDGRADVIPNVELVCPVCGRHAIRPA